MGGTRPLIYLSGFIFHLATKRVRGREKNIHPKTATLAGNRKWRLQLERENVKRTGTKRKGEEGGKRMDIHSSPNFPERKGGTVIDIEFTCPDKRVQDTALRSRAEQNRQQDERGENLGPG